MLFQTYDVFKRTYGYRMPYFFDSNAYKNGNFKKIELTKVYRQEDTELLENLINIRKNINIEDSIAYFNTCKITDKNILNTAITIKTLDKVIIEMSKGAFASGQLYVALSRTRHKADIHIPKRIDEADIIIDDRIVEFLG